MVAKVRGAVSGWRQRRYEKKHPPPHRDRTRPRTGLPGDPRRGGGGPNPPLTGGGGGALGGGPAVG